jgi:hypothetical protein
MATSQDSLNWVCSDSLDPLVLSTRSSLRDSAAACSGRLTEDWRAKHLDRTDAEHNWESVGTDTELPVAWKWG